MRAFHVGSMSLVTTIAALLAGCAGGPGPGGPFAPPPPPRPALFISPFGEPFTAEPGQPWPVADWFLGADENLDGAVTFEEFSADGQRWFARLDADRDGRLNQTELLAYEQSLRGLGGMGRGGEGPGGGPPGPERGPGGMAFALPESDARTAVLGVAPQQGGPGGQMRRDGGRGRPGSYGLIAEAGFFNLPQPVKSADVNVDQRVTAEEWANATQRWFLSLDTDQDGKLTLAALPKTPLQAQAERR